MINASTLQAICRVASPSRHGLARHASHSPVPQASNAIGTPSSTARCSGRLCALSKISQKRAPGYSVVKWAKSSSPQPQPNHGF